MSKYIDKEVLLERMNRTRPYEGENGSFERHRRLQWLADIGQINMCPAADVVEVVRCKDCKYLDYVDEHEKWCMGRGYPATMVKDDGYCEIGKRKEES